MRFKDESVFQTALKSNVSVLNHYCVCVCVQIRGGQEAVEWHVKRDALRIRSLVCSNAPQRCQDAQTLNTASFLKCHFLSRCPSTLESNSVHGVEGHLHDYSVTQEETKELYVFTYV